VVLTLIPCGNLRDVYGYVCAGAFLLRFHISTRVLLHHCKLILLPAPKIFQVYGWQYGWGVPGPSTTVAGLSAYYTRCCGLSEALLVCLKPSLLHTFITTWHHNALGVMDAMGVVQ